MLRDITMYKQPLELQCIIHSVTDDYDAEIKRIKKRLDCVFDQSDQDGCYKAHSSTYAIIDELITSNPTLDINQKEALLPFLKSLANALENPEKKTIITLETESKKLQFKDKFISSKERSLYWLVGAFGLVAAGILAIGVGIAMGVSTAGVAAMPSACIITAGVASMAVGIGIFRMMKNPTYNQKRIDYRDELIDGFKQAYNV